MRRLGMLLVALTFLGAGGYVFVYLYRWEWNRALVALGIFLAAEIAVAAAILLRRLDALARSSDRRGTPRGGADPAVLAALREAPAAPTPFRWLGVHPERTSVFIPVLLGAGVVVAGVAWLVERLAGATARPGVDHGLAEDLSVAAFPRDGLVPDDVLVLADGGGEDDEALRRLVAPARTGS